MNKTIKSQKGFFLIEAVIASSVIAAVLIYLLSSIQNSVEVSQRSLERTQAAYLLEETTEAIKSLRDDAWATINALTPGTTYYLSWNGTDWVTTTTVQTVGNFTRSFTISPVLRDGSSDIVASGGTDDAGTKKIIATVTWLAPSGTKTESLSFYISNIR